MTDLGDVTSLIVDCEHKTAPKCDDGHPLIRTTDLGSARIDFSNAQRIDAEAYDKWTRRAIPTTGDIILAREAPVGPCGIVPEDERPALGQRTVLIRADPECADPRFLCYLLAGSQMQEVMAAIANGSTVPHLNMEDIRRLPLPDLPLLDVQAKVADVLSAFDELIANSERRIAVLEDCARSLYREWFVAGRAARDGQANLPTESLGSVGSWFSGGTPSTSVAEYWGGTIPWITSGSLTSFVLRDSERRLTPEGVAAGSRLVDRDTVLFVVRGMSLAKEFRHGIADRPMAFGQDCKALVARPGVDPLFLAFAVDALASRIEGMVEYAAHGTGKLSTDRLKALEIPVPRPELQSQFVDAVRPMREQISVLAEEADRLRVVRASVLPRLVVGSIGVDDLGVDDAFGWAELAAASSDL